MDQPEGSAGSGCIKPRLSSTGRFGHHPNVVDPINIRGREVYTQVMTFECIEHAAKCSRKCRKLGTCCWNQPWGINDRLIKGGLTVEGIFGLWGAVLIE
ncbi:hypothetical protein [Pseudomonas gingeri]|uniref:Uncharacterized protein n=1 Tax=Pseudomonas gingeri TaxID=117681 RepID=A0A7Y8CMF7_9PSED|nr:hypothetical protein [Pseudomonas gingeri]NWA01350.1 hypothetical protein [Pseudomonas gingeri]NWA13847.1 hypothetical protein [Pseudomonas gingeri]NWA52793.1 hypothetical protein [Pseudomonas gingeri]NWA96290.1 hypothetical protein [Pseudomonas gingeri]NWB00074.1 hypothetical protein [Pseudomonas gingeri]